MRVAIVEDNKVLANGISHFLKDQGHAVDTLHDGIEALEFLKQHGADVIVLDINLPSLSGLDLLKQLRRNQDATPIILLTARGDLQDRLTGLDAGADDYLVKPFEMEELEARLRALMRRKPTAAAKYIHFGELSYDRSARKLHLNDVPLNIPRRELAVFECLFDRQNTIVTKTQLADHIYGIGSDVDEKVVEIYISRLRKKLSAHGVTIKAARGLGYMMDLPK